MMASGRLPRFMALAFVPLIAAHLPHIWGLHPNGLLEVRLAEPFQAENAEQIEGLERALDCDDATAILVITSSADAPRKLLPRPSLSLDERRRAAVREHGLHALISEASAHVPVVHIGDGPHLSASATGLFLAAPTRVCTGRTVLALPECRRGLCPGSGSLFFLSRDLPPHMAMYVALSGAQLNPHDSIRLGMATHYVCQSEVLSLLNELRCAPAGYLDVPLGRRASDPPQSLASLFADDLSGLLDDALLKAFGEEANSVDDVRSRLDEERQSLNNMLRSCGWRTRERAEGVVDVLDAAAMALKRASPEATAATFDALRECRRKGLDETQARKLELDLLHFGISEGS